MMPKKEISRIPYPAKQRLSLWLQLHPILEMQHQLPHLIATRMVLHFLWIIRPTLDGSHYAGRQWGTGSLYKVASQAVNLPLSVNSILFAAAADGGDGAFTLGAQIENRTLKIYQAAAQNPGNALAWIGYRYIAICEG